VSHLGPLIPATWATRVRGAALAGLGLQRIVCRCRKQAAPSNSIQRPAYPSRYRPNLPTTNMSVILCPRALLPHPSKERALLSSPRPPAVISRGVRSWRARDD